MFRRALLNTTRTTAATLRRTQQQSNSARSPATFFSQAGFMTRSIQPSFAPNAVQTKRFFSTEGEEVAMPAATGEKGELDATVARVVDEITQLNLLQVSQLVAELKDRLGLPDVAPMAMGAMPAASGAVAGGDAAPPAEEKTIFDVKLTGFDDKAKIKVIKEVRALTGLGLKEAKAAVEASPNVIGTGMAKEEAEAWMAKLKEVGGTVELE